MSICLPTARIRPHVHADKSAKPGTYKICRPIVQFYYTQFVGDAISPPTIKGCKTFVGIGLIDTDPYVPGGNGVNWFINQNQFFRQIRNFIFDLNDMPLSTDDDGQPLVPTGIHWQVSQACSLQNLVFNMPVATTSNKATHVGIFMENGSGGFVSDLVRQSNEASLALNSVGQLTDSFFASYRFSMVVVSVGGPVSLPSFLSSSRSRIRSH